MGSKWYVLRQTNKNVSFRRSCEHFCNNCYNTVASPRKSKEKQKLSDYFKQSTHLKDLEPIIPPKYFNMKRKTPTESLYLIDKYVAKTAASQIIPDIINRTDHLVCETNVGLGLITQELLEGGIPLVRMYESCSEFREYLKQAFDEYKGHVELFSKDLFLLTRYEYIDKQDNGDRVEQLLKDVPKKAWTDDPILTIIGATPNRNFLHYLIRSLAMQSLVTSFGRFQLYLFMTPRDYIVATAGPHLNLHTYQRMSVLFNLLCDCELLEKYPRKVFIPWQTLKFSSSTRYPSRVDTDLMYFVKITFKKDLPVCVDNLLPLYIFVNQFFGSGNNRIIPVLEKWIPGVGLQLIAPRTQYPNSNNYINIYTKFRTLTPSQILCMFNEMIVHPEYSRNHFLSLIESHLIKTETVETNLDDHLQKTETSSKIVS